MHKGQIYGYSKMKKQFLSEAKTYLIGPYDT